MKRFLSLIVVLLLSSTTFAQYTSTNDWAGVDATKPLDTDPVSQGASAIRQTRFTAKAQAAGLPTMNVKWYGAKGDGVTDDKAAIQAAVNKSSGSNVVFFPMGTYNVSDAISCPYKGQIFQGEGRARSVVQATSNFNLSAQGVFVCSSGEEGPQWKDLKITFQQPDTTNRTSLIAYPPAIYAQATPRFTVQNCSITEAMAGIDMRGNSGGAFIEQLEMSAYNTGINIDGSLDSVRINQFHFWSFDLTANQLKIFQDTNVVGLLSGRCDDLHVTDSLFINNGAGAKFISTGSGTTFGSIAQTDFDNFGGLVVQAGTLGCVNSVFTLGNVTNQAIIQTGGSLRVDNCDFQAGGQGNQLNPVVSLTGAGSILVGFLQIMNSRFAIAGTDMTSVYATNSNTIILTGNTFLLPQNQCPTNAVIQISDGARATIIGNRFTDKGSCSGLAIRVKSDDFHAILGNALVGWILTNATITSAVITNNTK